MKIALGTVQFGQAYGTFNRVGQVPLTSVESILDVAHARGVTLLDTAHAYGDSEVVLGHLGAGKTFRIVTKIPSLTGPDAVAKARSAFAESLERLRLHRVDGVMVHRAADLLGDQAHDVWLFLSELRKRGVARRVGFSAYGPEEARAILGRFPVDLVQVPLNVFDTRHLDSGLLDLCQSRGVEVHARSVFLQGFLLSDPAALPAHLAQYRESLGRFRQLCEENNRTQLQAALLFVLSVEQVDRVVVGVETAKQLHGILDAAGDEPLQSASFRSLRCLDLNLIDPSRWH